MFLFLLLYCKRTGFRIARPYKVENGGRGLFRCGRYLGIHPEFCLGFSLNKKEKAGVGYPAFAALRVDGGLLVVLSKLAGVIHGISSGLGHAS